MENEDGKKGMFRAYQVAQEMIKDRLEDVDEEAAKEMGEVAGNEVIVARGAYDFIERVFSKMEMPHKVVDPSAFEALGRRPNRSCF